MKREARTLIVDDSRSVLRVMEKILNDLGITGVAKAGNGLQAVELFAGALRSGTPYSLVFLDIIMPVMDGQEALLRMRALEREAGIAGSDRATIIMASSRHSPEDMMRALVEGDCTDYLVKPFDDEDLRGMLVRYGFV
ncbi:MAG: response regulator [Deltaproteobacteria bacterium]|nr:response regulator [Deltaproteobacteria bacterium]